MTKEKLIQMYEMDAECEGEFASESEARLVSTLKDIADLAGLGSPDVVSNIMFLTSQLSSEYVIYTRRCEARDNASDTLRRLRNMD